MIFRIIAALEIAFIFYSMFKSIRSEQKQDYINGMYARIDDILLDREKSKRLEDLISSSQAYKMGEVEKAISIVYSDASGTKHEYQTFISEDALKYFERESDKNHDRIMDKINKLIKPF